MSNATQAEVFYGKKKAGILSKSESGYEFAYLPEYLSDPDALPIGLALPLRAERYVSTDLFPFFQGLLPEGWLLDLITRTSKIDQRDQFNLLLQVGENMVGAVSVRPIKEE